MTANGQKMESDKETMFDFCHKEVKEKNTSVYSVITKVDRSQPKDPHFNKMVLCK